MKEKEAHKEFVKVIEEYSQLLADEKKQLGLVNDISLLTADKKTLKLYLLVALMSCKTTNELAFYYWAYMELATFQPNVGINSALALTNTILLKKLDNFQKSKSKETKDYIWEEIKNTCVEHLQYQKIIDEERKKLEEELEKLDI